MWKSALITYFKILFPSVFQDFTVLHRLHTQRIHCKSNLPSTFKNDGIHFKSQLCFLFMAAFSSLGTWNITVYLRLREGRIESFPGGNLIPQKALAESQVIYTNILLPRCFSFSHVSIYKPFEKSSEWIPTDNVTPSVLHNREKNCTYFTLLMNLKNPMKNFLFS